MNYRRSIGPGPVESRPAGSTAFHRRGPVLKKFFLLFGSLAGICLWCACGWADDQADARSILSRVDLLRHRGNLVIAGHPIASRHVLPQLYERRAHAPLWTRTTTDQLLTAIDRSREEGLTPEDYHRSGLLEAAVWLGRGAEDHERRAEFDILATDAFIRLAYNLFSARRTPTNSIPTGTRCVSFRGSIRWGF